MQGLVKFLLVVGLATATAPAATAGLIGYWPLNEGRGQVVHDWSGHHLDGYLGTAPGPDAYDPSWVGRFPFAALRFDGTDLISLPDSPLLEPQQLTVAALFRGNGSPGPFHYLLSKGGSACDNSSYGLDTGFGGGVGFYVSDGTKDGSVHSTEAPASIWDGRWHLAAGTYDGSIVRLFIDGRQMGVGRSGPLVIGYDLPSDVPLIGGYHVGCDLLIQGDLAHVSVWDRALSIAQLDWRFAALRGD